jgi:uridine kinase
MDKICSRIFRDIERLSKEKKTFNIAIDGFSGAGKSKLADIIASVYDCNIIHMDYFFLTPGQRTEARLNEAGGNIDYERFMQEAAEGLAKGQEFSYRRYDCRKQDFVETITVKPRKFNVVEGVYSMHPSLTGLYDYKIFLKASEEEQKRRILEREGEEQLKIYIDRWIPLEMKYFNELNIESKCDIVISTDNLESFGKKGG